MRGEHRSKTTFTGRCRGAQPQAENRPNREVLTNMFSWLSGKSNTITSAAAIVALFSILSRFVGFIRDRILAGAFGASDTLDIYFAAFRIPDLMFQLVVVGALSASFIPIFTKYYHRKRVKKAWKFTNTMLTLLAIGFGVITVVMMFVADPLAALVAPGFDPEKSAAVADMSRVMFLAQLLLALSMIYGSVLQGAKRFFLYSLAPIFYNIGIIVGVVWIATEDWPIGLAWGVVLGAALHFLTQWLGARDLGHRFKPRFVLKDKDVVYTLKHMMPRTLGLAVGQVNIFLMTAIASTLAVGSVTVLQFAYNLNFFAVGIIGVSYAIAAYPTLCELASDRKKTALVKTISTTARQMLFFLVPATVLFILLRAQVVRLVVGAGQFDWEATILTANTLGFFALSLTLQALVFLLVRVYFARGQTVAPFIIGVIAAIVHGASAIILTQSMEVVGLGAAYSIAIAVQFLLLWGWLRTQMGSLDELRIMKSLWIFIAAAVACGVTTQVAKTLVVELITLDTFFGVLAQLLIAGGVGLIIYVLVAYLFKSQELLDVLGGLKRKLMRRHHPEEAILDQS